MAVNLLGVSAVCVFYLIVLAVGVFAAWKQKKSLAGQPSGKPEETIMLAKRNLGIFVGVLTMTGILSLLAVSLTSLVLVGFCNPTFEGLLGGRSSECCCGTRAI